ALSATMLAMSGSGVAFAAGTCTSPVTAGDPVVCNGTFADDVSNYVDPGDFVPDMTLVVGSDGITTVDPADGVNGINAYWDDATVITSAEINVINADGVHVNNHTVGGSVDAFNYGSITSTGTTQGARGVDVHAYGTAVANNGGDV